MTEGPYIWAIPPAYPDRLVGIYDRRHSLHYLSVKQGVPVEPESPPIIGFRSATLDDVSAYDCLSINALIPLIAPVLAEHIRHIAGDAVQLVPANLIAADGSRSDYALLNVLELVECIDPRLSLPIYIQGALVDFHRLVFSSGCMGERAFARERSKHSLLLVSNWAKEALMKKGYTGLHFMTADEFFPPSGPARPPSTTKN